MKYDTVLFDWDGCLVHTLEVWLKAVHLSLKKERIRLSDKEIVEKILQGKIEFSTIGFKDSRAFWDSTTAYIVSHHDEITLHTGVKSTLSLLKKKGIKLSIVTRSYRHIFEGMYEGKGIDHLIDLVITHDDVAHQKPHPESVLLAMKKLRSKPSTTLIVGDSEHEVRAGQAAGIDTVLFYPPHNEAFYNIDDHHALEATYMIHSFKELLPIVIGQ